MIEKVLIANRGEIACRVIATARRMGIATVAVHSDADAEALHVTLADEAVRVGPAPSAESYLVAERILQAARVTGADAIHPGYGFLSENAEFAAAVEASGLTWIGPPPEAIRAMGLKDAAKAAMEAAGVPVVPGYHGSRQDADVLAAEAERIGYPVLIKARAGGGGKGIRLVETPAAFRDALAGARREAEASFGDAACLVEKYVSRPRHIEIQVFADAHGGVVHAFERDCSLQRRHQKVIEEAPAPGMSDAVRSAMGRAAVEAARAIGYRGAGTVEFIADGSGQPRADGFWFMEMNTRLQVEHPVSEAITGLDFVELQFRIAAGEPLPFRQEDLAIRGHAVEARVYAEDVGRGFLPATGRLHHLRLPEAAAFEAAPVRIDSGVREGDAISPWYDPMIAKVIAHGPTREAAFARLAAALDRVEVAGAVTNVGFLAALARDPDVRAGHVDTGLIARKTGALIEAGPVPDLVVALAAVAGPGLDAAGEGHDPWDALTGWRLWSEATLAVDLDLGGARLSRVVSVHGRGRFLVSGGAAPVDLEIVGRDGNRVSLRSEGRLIHAAIARGREGLTIFLEGGTHVFALPDALANRDDDGAGGDAVIAPMPGVVKVVAAAAGRAVARGETLVVLEAMKMEHTLTAPRDGVVAEVRVAAGEQVSDGAILATLEPENG